MQIAPVTSIPSQKGTDSHGWTITEHRVVVVDGVRVQYEVARKTTTDMNGLRQEYAAVKLRWSTGERALPTAGFPPGMTDAELAVNVRNAMKGQNENAAEAIALRDRVRIGGEFR